jgi:hypothetical protein
VAAFATSGIGFNPSASGNSFIGPTLDVPVTAGQKLILTVSKIMGTTLAGGADGLTLYPCSQPAAGGSLIFYGGGLVGLTAPPNSRNLYGVNTVITGLNTGTYTVGMCGGVPIPGVWNNNDNGYISVIVTN